MTKRWVTGGFFFLFTFAFSGNGSLEQFIKDGDLLVDLRFRLEAVDQGSFEKDALASTLRGRIGYQTGVWNGFQALVEFEGLATIFGEDLYNDTVNGVKRPVIADREGAEINRLQLNYQLSDSQAIHFGRQRLRLDNTRLIGNAPWRQREMTFDAAIWKWNPEKGYQVTAGYIDNANLIFGDDHPTNADFRMEGWILNSRIPLDDQNGVSFFGYFFENKTRPALSHRNLGFYGKGRLDLSAQTQFLWEASYVDQDDHKDGNPNLDEDYVLAAVGVGLSGLELKVGFEQLGGDGLGSFITPHASRHGPNGWADRFLNTPLNGLKDFHHRGYYKFQTWQIKWAYHVFQSDQGNIDYGEEIDFVVSKQMSKRSQVSLKFADYQADQYDTDTTKIWALVQWIW